MCWLQLRLKLHQTTTETAQCTICDLLTSGQVFYSTAKLQSLLVLQLIVVGEDSILCWHGDGSQTCWLLHQPGWDLQVPARLCFCGVRAGFHALQTLVWFELRFDCLHTVACTCPRLSTGAAAWSLALLA